MRRFIRWTVGTVAVVVLSAGIATDCLAFGSSEKTPEEQTEEKAKEAVKVYNKGVEFQSEATIQLARGDSARAVSRLKDASALYLRAADKFKKAVSEYEKAVESNPEFAEAFSNLGYCRRNLGDHNEALAAYDRALELKPDFAEALEYRGIAYLQLGRRADAVSDLTRLKEIDVKLAAMLEEAIMAAAGKKTSSW